MKFGVVSKAILTNFDKFVQFIKYKLRLVFKKILGNFKKNLRETLKTVKKIFSENFCNL